MFTLCATELQWLSPCFRSSLHLFTQSRRKGYRLTQPYTVQTVSPVPSALLHYTKLSSSAGCTTSCTSFSACPVGDFPLPTFAISCLASYGICPQFQTETRPDGRRISCQRSTLIFKIHAMPHYTVLRPWAQSAWDYSLTLGALVCVLLPIAGAKLIGTFSLFSSGYGG